MNFSKKRLKDIILKFSNSKILVVGDLILDHYIFGNVERISPEAPVPVVCAKYENFLCGGAANVGVNISAFNAKVSICGVIGSDSFGDKLFSLIKSKNIDTRFIIKDKNRPTTLKSRIIAQHQQMVRIDWESTEPLSSEINNKILKNIKDKIKDFDAIIIEDYGKGVINSFLVSELVSIAKKEKKIITVDPKEEHFQYYKNVTALTPNLKEAQNMANIKIKTKEEIPNLAKEIIKNLNPDALVITLGEDGMMLFVKDKNYHIPASALEVFDVTGAGDTVISVFTLALTSGASFLEAAIISNLAAGIVVGKLGAATTNKDELLNRIKDIK